MPDTWGQFAISRLARGWRLGNERLTREGRNQLVTIRQSAKQKQTSDTRKLDRASHYGYMLSHEKVSQLPPYGANTELSNQD
jgi:hypothetical protein